VVDVVDVVVVFVVVDVVELEVGPVVLVVVDVDVVVVSVVVTEVDVVEVDVRVVELGPGGMGLKPLSAGVVVRPTVVVVLVVVSTQLLLLSVPPHVVRKPPKMMRESSAESSDSKKNVMPMLTRGCGSFAAPSRPIESLHSGQTSQCRHSGFEEPKYSLQSTSMAGSNSWVATGNESGLPM
jgi:hypothetical protein